jgi:hypothetical protein
MIVELPDQKESLQQNLLEIESSVRRKTWKYPTPEDILQLVVIQQPPNSELHNQLKNIEQKTQQMADEPGATSI